MDTAWTVSFTDAKKRLDVFLTERIPHATRSAIAKELKKGAGKINGKTATIHAFLKEGDDVVFKPVTAVKKPESEPKMHAAHKTQPVKYSPTIIKETPDWIVIDKPSGLLVHPTAEEETDTLADWLVEHDPKIGKIGEDPSRPGIMHRLDREVSGLMVVAKSQNAFDDLKKQFAEHSTVKTYLALAHGNLPKDEGEIKFKIARSKQGGRMAARPESDEQGKAAWTHYKVIKRFKNATLVELQIMSGRTHQIRAHLFAMGCPVVGDVLYSRKDIKPIKTPRLLLQATKLEFADPKTQKRQKFELPMDQAFDNVMSKLAL